MEGRVGAKLEVDGVGAALAVLASVIVLFDACLRANDALNIGDNRGSFRT
jgi:hypothetical protein